MKKKLMVFAASLLFSASSLTSYAKEGQSNDSSMEYYNKGRSLYRSLTQSDLEEAIKQYDKGISINKNNPYLYAGKTETLYLLYFYQMLRGVSNIEQSKLIQEIGRNAAIAHDLSPDLQESHKAMAISYTVQEVYEDAKNEALKAIEMNKADSESYLWLWNTGSSLNPEDKSIITASALDPNSPLINLFWAIGYEFSGEDWQKNKQIDLLNKVIKESPDNDIAYSLLGSWYFKYKTDNERAINNFGKALYINPENPFVLFNMGKVYEKKKMDWKAVEYYKQACEMKNKNACQKLKEKNY